MPGMGLCSEPCYREPRAPRPIQGARAGALWGLADGRELSGAGVRAIGKEGPLGAVRDQLDLRVVSQFDEGPLIANSRLTPLLEGGRSRAHCDAGVGADCRGSEQSGLLRANYERDESVK